MIRSQLLWVNPSNHPAEQNWVIQTKFEAEVAIAGAVAGHRCCLMVEFGSVSSAVGSEASGQAFMKVCDFEKNVFLLVLPIEEISL